MTAKDKKAAEPGAGEIGAMSFEEALKELEQIVGKLEDGSVDLEDSIRIYERGTQLKSHCEAKLADAQARIEKIRMSDNGTVSAEPARFE